MLLCSVFSYLFGVIVLDRGCLMLSLHDRLCDMGFGGVLTMDGYDDCVVGVLERFGMEPFVVYDKELVLEKLEEDGCDDRDSSTEYYEFNQLGAWLGEATPGYLVSVRIRESSGSREQRRLVDWIDGKGGKVSVRAFQQGQRKYRTAVDSEAALDELNKAGLGSWQYVPADRKGGRPTRVFKLSTVSTPTNP